MDKIYDFLSNEAKWNKKWSDEKTYHTNPDSRECYSIVIPPPNVTDILHLGHAFNNSIQDILIRYHRNRGYNAEWLPGTDHAGIATQVVVEKLLKKEGKKKEDFGRDKFEQEVWKWAKDRRFTILNQLKGIGASCDWERTKFTLDEDMSKTVAVVFKKLYEKKYIYKGNYIVNWCPRCHTALSDEEVDYHEKNGKLYYIRYPLSDNSGHITVATTRPETMLGDSAVAVNPHDEGKKHLIGKKVTLPLMKREIEIIADEFVDKEFGTGFVKVTPAHDPNDFTMGMKHNLDKRVIMDTRGFINDNGGKYKGLERYKAREEILKDLEELNLIEKIEDYKNSVGECYRCKTTIEPYLSEQWFVDMTALAKPALEASLNNTLKFYPARWQGVYNHWLMNIKPWCISRQLWWGHRIPVYYCDSCESEHVSVEKLTECPKCGGTVRQDENVLDTWFSSWLWPFATFGWSDNSSDYRYFYPTKVIVSASEILFFWIARMIMAGIEFTGELPFRDIFIHGTVRDSKGVKMSKSLGNGIDPLVITNKFGADALRFTIVFLSGQGKDPNISEKSFELGRNFANKIWNAARFILSDSEEKAPHNVSPEDEFDGWILSRLSEAEKNFNSAIGQYRLSDGAQIIYEFFWKDFCDWYLEIMKARGKKKATALFVLKRVMMLLNPYMPYITEELHQILGGKSLIHEETYSEFEFSDSLALERVENLKSLIVALRNLMQETNAKRVFVLCDEDFFNTSEKSMDLLLKLSKLEAIDIVKEKAKRAIAVPFAKGIVFVSAEQIGNLEERIIKYEKELSQINSEIEKTERNLKNEGFLSKADESVIQMMKEKVVEFSSKKERIEEILKSLR
ncbi:MAG: valine--tRNA ligase [bacterium]